MQLYSSLQPGTDIDLSPQDGKCQLWQPAWPCVCVGLHNCTAWIKSLYRLLPADESGSLSLI